MSSLWASVLLMALLNALGDILGAALPGLRRMQTRAWMGRLIAIAAGLLLATSLLSLLPEVFAATPQGVAFVLVGYLAMLAAENLFATHAHEPHPAASEVHVTHALVGGLAEEEPLISDVAAGAAVAGLSVHAFFDGVAVAAALSISAALGNVVSLAVFLHKLPEGFGVASIVLAAGRGRGTSLAAGVLLGALTVLGATTALVIEGTEPGLTGSLLGFATGTLLYVAATDLVPAANEARDRTSILAVLLGVALMFAGRWLAALAGLD